MTRNGCQWLEAGRPHGWRFADALTRSSTFPPVSFSCTSVPKCAACAVAKVHLVQCAEFAVCTRRSVQGSGCRVTNFMGFDFMYQCIIRQSVSSAVSPSLQPDPSSLPSSLPSFMLTSIPNRWPRQRSHVLLCTIALVFLFRRIPKLTSTFIGRSFTVIAWRLCDGRLLGRPVATPILFPDPTDPAAQDCNNGIWYSRKGEGTEVGRGIGCSSPSPNLLPPLCGGSG